MKTRLSLTVNGETHDVLVPVHKTLLEVLREDLGLTGTKPGCGCAACGACQPGSPRPAQACVAARPSPTRQEVKEALAGNLCRCTGYTKILDAVELAALRMGVPR